MGINQPIMIFDSSAMAALDANDNFNTYQTQLSIEFYNF